MKASWTLLNYQSVMQTETRGIFSLFPEKESASLPTPEKAMGLLKSSFAIITAEYLENMINDKSRKTSQK